MNTRRDFLSIVAKGSAMEAVTTLLPGTASASRVGDAMEGNSMEQTAGSKKKEYFPFSPSPRPN